MRIAIVFFAILACLLSPANAKSSNRSIVKMYRVNSIMQPKSLPDTFFECMRDPVCKAVLGSATDALGIPSEAVEIAGLAAPSKRKGEDTSYAFYPPKGYLICAAKVRTMSVVPASGSRATTAGFNAHSTGFGVYTWTPRRPLFEGRSFYDGYLTIKYVRASRYPQLLVDGECTVTSKPRRIGCKGRCGNYDF